MIDNSGRLKSKTKAIASIVLSVLSFSLAANLEAAALKNKTKTKSARQAGVSAVGLESLKQKALQMYMVRNYPEACKLFRECVKREPRDASFQYYLGVSALYANELEVAEHALCRVVVMTEPTSEWGTLAGNALKDWKKQFSSIRPYSQSENGNLRRWDKSKGEIKVWIADGLQLPQGFVGPDLTVDKCRTLYSLFDRPGFFSRLDRVEHYVPNYASIIREGINDWAWVAAEGIVKFKFVDDPKNADVLYFWCPQSGGDSVGRTFYPWTNTARARCIVHVETSYLRKWGANTPKQLRETSAHEFGHVLGLGQHSNLSSDVMRGHGETISWMQQAQYSNVSPVTRNDFVTLRALYELPPDYLYVPLSEK